MAYFDGPGGTQVPQAVVDAMTEYLLHHNANTHWDFPTSLETDQLLDDARRALADFLNASPAEIAFGTNMTTLTFHLGRALGRGWGPGDEIVVTELDHHANVAPWQALARERGVTLRLGAAATRRRASSTGTTSSSAVTPRTRLVAIGAASNALGTINDVARAAALAHGAGALAFVDAVHYAPHALVDVARAGLRLPGLLGLQVLRAARRRAVRPARPARLARRPQAAAGAGHGARAAGDRHAEPRGHRRRRGGGGVPRVAGGLRAWRVAVAPRRAASGCLPSCTRAARRWSTRL